VCTRESGAVYEAGGLNCVLTFIKEHGHSQSQGEQSLKVFTDTLHSAMSVVTRLCGKMEPQDASLPACIESLSTLLKHEDCFVSTPGNDCCLGNLKV
jgi:E3 ubiquitin-protein ligase HECTD1